MSRRRYYKHVFYDMASNQDVIATFDAKEKTWNVPAWQTECGDNEEAKIAYLKGKVETYEKILKDKGIIGEGKE